MITKQGWLFVFLFTAAFLMLASKARAADSVASLPPVNTRSPSDTYSCQFLRNAVALFGEALVVAEARRRGVSEQVIAQQKRKCFGGRESPS